MTTFSLRMAMICRHTGEHVAIKFLPRGPDAVTKHVAREVTSSPFLPSCSIVRQFLPLDQLSCLPRNVQNAPVLPQELILQFCQASQSIQMEVLTGGMLEVCQSVTQPPMHRFWRMPNFATLMSSSSGKSS